MFRGVSSVNVDAKGRMAVPAKYRERLLDECDGRLVATIDVSDSTNRCLMVYPEPKWEEVERKFMQLPSLNEGVKRMQRLLLGYANECQIDGQGRILLSQSLRGYAGVDKKVVVVGQGYKFEIWRDEVWRERSEQWLAEAPASIDQLPDDVKNLAF